MSSLTDPLVGLTNPREREALDLAFANALMDMLEPVSVAIYGVVNDEFGHQIGDEVLILVGRILKKSFRGSDRIYRFGGEEFVVLVRVSDDEMALDVGERFRKQMESFKFAQVGRLTASVGLAEIRAGDSPTTVCAKADQAVYFAKKNGRNRVCNHSDLVRQGLLQSEAKVSEVDLF